MGLSSKKTKTTTTTTPTVAEPYGASFENFTGKIDEFLGMDPTQFVAPASELQTNAFGQAKNLGGWKPYMQKAGGYASQGADAKATQINPYGYTPPTISGAYTMSGAKLGDPSQVDLSGYDLPDLADPSRLLQYMDDYQNPYTDKVVNAAMADFDEYAGQQRAAMAANAGMTGAFGGSRYGIAQGQLEGELARGRASTEATLLDQQYRLAAELAGTDANTANQFALTEYGAGIDQARYGADANNEEALTNQDAINNFLMQQGLFDQQTDTINMGAMNDFLKMQTGMDADAARYYADALNQGNVTNANLLEQSYLRDLQAAGLLGDLSQGFGSQSRGDLATTAGLGEMQRGVQSDHLNAIPKQLQLAGQLYSQLYPGIYAGSNSTSTTKGGGGLLPTILGTGMQAAAPILF